MEWKVLELDSQKERKEHEQKKPAAAREWPFAAEATKAALGAAHR